VDVRYDTRENLNGNRRHLLYGAVKQMPPIAVPISRIVVLRVPSDRQAFLSGSA